MKKFIIRLSIFILLFIMTSSMALAQSEARVYLQPVSETEESVTVEVRAENVTDMYGAEFRLRYDPNLLSVQDLATDQEGIQIEPGSFLPAQEGFVVANQVDETNGTITFALTLLNPAPAVSGSGPLARITFKRLQNSPATIEIERAKLVAIDLQTIPSQSAAFTLGSDTPADDHSPTPVGGDPAPAAPTDNFPWWIIAAIIIMGGAALVGMVIFGGLHKTQPEPEPVPQQPQPRRGSGRRPSAFNNPPQPPT